MATYEIIIKNETEDSDGTSESKAVAGNNSSTEKKEKKQLSAGQVAVGKGLVAFKMAQPWINQIASHEVSLVELRTGSREAQQKAQFTYDVASKAVGLGTSILTGYAVGNIPGAIVAGLLNIGHTIVSYAQKEETINLQRSLESRTLQMNYIRAGAGGSRRAYE